MRRSFIILTIFTLIIGGVVLLFPMRAAISLAGLERLGFAAQEVSGTIWSGRLKNVQLRGIRLGSFDAGLDPLTLLATPAIDVRRVSASGRALTARLSGSGDRLLVQDASGDISIAALSGRIPVSLAQIDNVDIELDNGRCVSASGDIRVLPSGLLARFMASEGLAGTVRCQGENIAMQMQSPQHRSRFNIAIDSQQRYEMTLTLTGLPKEIAFGLRALGFEERGFEGRGDTLSISHEGVLR